MVHGTFISIACKHWGNRCTTGVPTNNIVKIFWYMHGTPKPPDIKGMQLSVPCTTIEITEKP